MDFQHLLDAALATLIGLVGFIMKSLQRKVEAIEQRVSDLHLTYAKKDEMKNGFDRMERMLERIMDNLEAKADKK